MTETIKAPLALTLICTAVCGLLALGNALTKDKIAAAEAATLQASLTAAFGEGQYTPLDAHFEGVNQVIRDAQGRCIFDITATGYEKDSQHLLIGIDAEGAVCGIAVVSISDSPTQSKKVQETAFLEQFQGQTEPTTTYDAISGATKSSSGIHMAVNLALDTYQTNQEVITHE